MKNNKKYKIKYILNQEVKESTLDLNKKLIMVGGPNGCGKTTLLEAIAQEFRDPEFILKLDDSKKPEKVFNVAFYKGDEKPKPSLNGKIFDNPLIRYTQNLAQTNMDQMTSLMGSHGEIMQKVFSKGFLPKVEEMSKQDHPLLILIDEPEVGWDIPFQCMLPNIIENLMKFGTVICASHCYLLYKSELVTEVYDLEQDKYISKEQYYEDINKLTRDLQL